MNERADVDYCNRCCLAERSRDPNATFKKISHYERVCMIDLLNEHLTFLCKVGPVGTALVAEGEDDGDFVADKKQTNNAEKRKPTARTKQKVKKLCRYGVDE